MSVILFLLVLSVLVLIHEAGHYLAARLFGVKADEFGYGFPPRLIGFVRDGKKWKRVSGKDTKSYQNTIWSINWLPLGGFVKIKGETENGMNDPDSIHAKPVWQRLTIIAAGVFMNWVLAVLIFTAVYTIGTTLVVDEVVGGAMIRDRATVITQILPASPAERAGLKEGDELVKIANTVITTSAQVKPLIQEIADKQIEVVIKRDGNLQTLQTTPEKIVQINAWGIGVGMADIGTVSFPLPQAFIAGIKTAWHMMVAILTAFFDIFRDLFTKQQVSQDVSGPVGIAVMTGQVAQQGIIPLLQFAAMLSLNLAVINFLPIPALDGGRAVFLIIEAIRRKPVSRRLEISIHNVAFLMLILLILLITARDVSKYSGAIMGGLKGLVGM
ncbi:RIP metalloprotease RseP [Candidatus Uhrbacteria bacterium]|nr:RIP metalloprotease RseP [Candidatus Uhrbacteria bacterium]